MHSQQQQQQLSAEQAPGSTLPVDTLTSEKLEGQSKLPYTSCTSAVRMLTAAPGIGMVRLVTVRQLACSVHATSTTSAQALTLQYQDAHCCLRRVRLWCVMVW